MDCFFPFISTHFVRDYQGRLRRAFGDKYAPGSYLDTPPRRLQKRALRERNISENRNYRFDMIEHEDDIKAELKIDKMVRVGGGSFGTVYLGIEREKPNDKFAMKIMASKFISDARRKLWERQVLNEAYMLNKTNHQHIVKFVDYIFLKHWEKRVNCFAVIKTELLDCDLSDICKFWQMPAQAVRLIARQAGSAIDYLHTHRIVHHDLKPENIMIARFDSDKDWLQQILDGEIKIIDLGLAQLQKKRNRSRAREGKYFGGSSFYHSPQKFDQTRYNPYLADAFAFGVILLELVLSTTEIKMYVSMTGSKMEKICQRKIEHFKEDGLETDHLESIKLLLAYEEKERNQVNKTWLKRFQNID